MLSPVAFSSGDLIEYHYTWFELWTLAHMRVVLELVQDVNHHACSGSQIVYYPTPQFTLILALFGTCLM